MFKQTYLSSNTQKSLNRKQHSLFTYLLLITTLFIRMYLFHKQVEDLKIINKKNGKPQMFLGYFSPLCERVCVHLSKKWAVSITGHLGAVLIAQ